jgi:hypothetical protein
MPSSSSVTEPKPSTGMPRARILPDASPPDDSTQKPGTDFIASVTEVGACMRSASSPMVLIE